MCFASHHHFPINRVRLLQNSNTALALLVANIPTNELANIIRASAHPADDVASYLIGNIEAVDLATSRQSNCQHSDVKRAYESLSKTSARLLESQQVKLQGPIRTLTAAFRRRQLADETQTLSKLTFEEALICLLEYKLSCRQADHVTLTTGQFFEMHEQQVLQKLQ